MLISANQETSKSQVRPALFKCKKSLCMPLCVPENHEMRRYTPDARGSRAADFYDIRPALITTRSVTERVHVRWQFAAEHLQAGELEVVLENCSPPNESFYF